MSEVLRGLAGGVRGAVIEVLSGCAPLRTKDVWRKVVAEGVSCTYQGVHKEIAFLEANGVVEKTGEGYAVRREWLSRLSSEVANALQAKEGPRGFTASKHGFYASLRAIALLNRLLLSGELRFSRDELVLQSNRISMLPLGLQLEWFGELRRRSPDFVYKTSREMGVEWFRRLREKGIARDPDDEMRAGVEALSIAGWGTLDVYRVDMERRTVKARLSHSPLAAERLERFGKSPHAVDDFTRGAFAGGWCVIFGDPTGECVETKCIGKGDPCCEFLVKPRGEFDLRDKEILRQLGRK